jgi:hypothetical protein
MLLTQGLVGQAFQPAFRELAGWKACPTTHPTTLSQPPGRKPDMRSITDELIRSISMNVALFCPWKNERKSLVYRHVILALDP